MKTAQRTTITASDPAQRDALASPLRLEILGLFSGGDPLAIADMAVLMGRTANSLYHHVGILEHAGLLQRKGTRPKGRRHEALFYPAASRLELEAEKGGEDAALARKTMSAAFRMAERDLEAAMRRCDCVTEGPGRNTLALRMHLRASPKLLAGINRHLKAIEELVSAEVERGSKPTARDQHVSLTLALLPLRGRARKQDAGGE